MLREGWDGVLREAGGEGWCVERGGERGVWDGVVCYDG